MTIGLKIGSAPSIYVGGYNPSGPPLPHACASYHNPVTGRGALPPQVVPATSEGAHACVAVSRRVGSIGIGRRSAARTGGM